MGCASGKHAYGPDVARRPKEAQRHGSLAAFRFDDGEAGAVGAAAFMHRAEGKNMPFGAPDAGTDVSDDSQSMEEDRAVGHSSDEEGEEEDEFDMEEEEETSETEADEREERRTSRRRRGRDERRIQYDEDEGRRKSRASKSRASASRRTSAARGGARSVFSEGDAHDRVSQSSLPSINSDRPLGRSWDRVQAVMARKSAGRQSASSLAAVPAFVA